MTERSTPDGNETSAEESSEQGGASRRLPSKTCPATPLSLLEELRKKSKNSEEEAEKDVSEEGAPSR